MYKKALIISDNPYLASKIFSTLKRKNLQKKFSLAISPFSKLIDFDFDKNVKPQIINLKKKESINEVIEKYDLLISVHCKQIFPKKIVDSIKCINIHPGYNPINRGWYPQVFAIINDLPIGATIHEIDEKLDHGNIIDRELVVKYDFDTSETLYNRIIEKEIELFDKNIEKIVRGEYISFGPEKEGNLYLKSDFKKLLELDLNEMVSLKEVINKLRALTHGKYNNAYYYDQGSKKKIFVSINLKSETEI